MLVSLTEEDSKLVKVIETQEGATTRLDEILVRGQRGKSQ